MKRENFVSNKFVRVNLLPQIDTKLTVRAIALRQSEYALRPSQ